MMCDHRPLVTAKVAISTCILCIYTASYVSAETHVTRMDQRQSQEALAFAFLSTQLLPQRYVGVLLSVALVMQCMVSNLKFKKNFWTFSIALHCAIQTHDCAIRTRACIICTHNHAIHAHDCAICTHASAIRTHDCAIRTHDCAIRTHDCAVQLMTVPYGFV